VVYYNRKGGKDSPHFVGTKQRKLVITMPYKEDEEGRRITQNWNLMRLMGKHRQICRLYCLGGMTEKAIAEVLGLHEQTVHRTLISEPGKKLIEEYTKGLDDEMLEVQRRLQEVSPLALDVLEEVITGQEAPLQIKVGVAKDLLDRAGHKPVTKVESRSAHVRIDSNFIKEIKERAAELDPNKEVYPKENKEAV